MAFRATSARTDLNTWRPRDNNAIRRTSSSTHLWRAVAPKFSTVQLTKVVVALRFHGCALL